MYQFLNCLRCLSDNECKVYQYNRNSQEQNCLLIHRNSTVDGGEIFKLNKNSVTYKKGWLLLKLNFKNHFHNENPLRGIEERNGGFYHN